MKAIRRITVRAVVPPELSAVSELAANLRSTWHEPTAALFRHISDDLWRKSRRDPVALLAAVPPERLDQLAADAGFVAWAGLLRDNLERYLGEPRWYQKLEDAPRAIAYFSPEFGVAEALPQYSGGLGILAGDHLKAASDLGVPLTGVGLFYRAGYFRQSISADGWQQESYPVHDPAGLPLALLTHPDGSPAHVRLALPEGRTLVAQVWRARVGRVPLLLLDTDVVENSEDLRSVTDRLYGGGGEHRLLQELLLGIGGVRALRLYSELTGAAVPEVFHTNEGHAGFLGLERLSELRGGGLDLEEALRVVRAGTVFTTHTPVAAGIDRFEKDWVQRYLSVPELLPGVPPEFVLGLGLESPDGPFNMAVMGLRLAQRANGVSKLHGRVSRSMFHHLYPDFDVEDVPITSVTNGVHTPTWTHPMLRALVKEHGEGAWRSEGVGDVELWSVRCRMREQLVHDARRRLARAWSAQNPGGVAPAWLSRVLDPGVLTIGFARRVPTYKRLTLMLHDPERLRRILLNPERPVQLVIAGKSHPADDAGKRLIQELVRFASDADVRERIVFLPDYDIAMAQNLYPGTDVWLNNPLRPLEACGTSGMKAALNGSLNLSILDGWWDECFDGENGWAIPSAEAGASAESRDEIEAAALYDLIEHRIAPAFYERRDDGVPERWLRFVRHTIATLTPKLGADRMVKEYVQRLYMPAAGAERRLVADDFAGARDFAAYVTRVEDAWPAVAVRHLETTGQQLARKVGESLPIRAWVDLGGLDPADVRVEAVSGRIDADGAMVQARHTELTPAGADGTGTVMVGEIPLARAGSFGYTVRVVPTHDLLAGPAELGLVAVPAD